MYLGKTAGIEFEYEDLPPEEVQFLVKKLSNREISWGLTRDASCESRGSIIKNSSGRVISLFGNTEIISSRRLGGELRSNLIDLTQEKTIRKNLENLCDGFYRLGETEQSLRAGIHIHINVGQMTLEMLRSLIKTACILEPVFFALGGMGYQLRGFQNNYTYSRPITKYGPGCVRIPRGYAQSVNVKECFEAKKIEEFFEKWGDTYRNQGSHMFPARYCWFNPCSISQRGSIEFRIFNKTLNPDKIWSVAKFCSEVVGYSIKHSYTTGYLDSFEENSIYDVNTISEISRIFDNFAIAWRIGEIEILLRKLINQVHENTIRPDPNFYFSHLFFHDSGDRTITHWENSTYSPVKIPKERIKRPKFYDSHLITREMLSPFNIEGLRF